MVVGRRVCEDLSNIREEKCFTLWGQTVTEMFIKRAGLQYMKLILDNWIRERKL